MSTSLLTALYLAVVVAFFAAALAASLLPAIGFPLPPTKGRIGHLGGLRGYLALAVMGHHFSIWIQVTRLGLGWGKPESNILENLGAGGVALFFMTTGALFYRKILGGIGGTNWIRLYVTRLFRIEPMVLCSVLIVAVIAATRTDRPIDLAANLRGLALWASSITQPDLFGYVGTGRINAYVLWSLRAEWIFYILLLPTFALAATLMPKTWPKWLLPAAILAAALLARLILPSGIKYLALFPIGMLAWEAHRRETFAARLRGPVAAIVALGCLIGGLGLSHSPFELLPLGLLSAFFVTIACGNSLFGLLRMKGSLVLGECSYAIYLLHGCILSVSFTELNPLWARIDTAFMPALLPLLAIVGTLITAAGYRLIELPALRYGQRLAARMTNARPRRLDATAELAP